MGLGIGSNSILMLGRIGMLSNLKMQEIHLTNQRSALVDDMDRLTVWWQGELSSKKLKMSGNAGASTEDITYSSLMRPGVSNKNHPYILTNSAGRVVLDRNYLDYAKLVSPDGSAGGDYDSKRSEILAGLIGISSDTVSKAEAASVEVQKALEAKNNAWEAYRSTLEKESRYGKKLVNAANFAEKAGKIKANGIEFDFKKLGTVDLGNGSSASSAIHSVMSSLADTMAKWLDDGSLNFDEGSYFKQACEQYAQYVDKLFTSPTDDDKKALTGASGLSGIHAKEEKKLVLKTLSYSIDLNEAMRIILGNYTNEIRNANSNMYESYVQESKEDKYTIRDRESTSWQNWKKDLEEKKAAYDAAEKEYNDKVNIDNQVMTAEQESQIAFYDELFQAIVDNGWEYVEDIEDPEYLNNMLLNNEFYITELTTERDIDGTEYPTYTSSPANTIDNFFVVNDTDSINAAFAKYTKEKQVINKKEERLDNQMARLKSQISALNQMQQAWKSIMGDNVKNGFSTFT